ncbi:MAG: galactose-1-phosphate uridylyltransferase [Candidatus Kapaibacterium sp.]
MKDKSEIRLNLATREWVIFAPERRKRPKDFDKSAAGGKIPEYDPDCPFCPGNEDKLPEIISEIADSSGWHTRVVPNKFPALERHYSSERYSRGIYTGMQGFGTHEVLIETPRHNGFPAALSQREMEYIIEMYHRRYCEVLSDTRFQMCIIFKNHGPAAGTSLEHPHSQLIGLGIVPRHIRTRENEAQRFYDIYNKCVFCHLMESELSHERRIVYENESFVGYIPYAADVPYQITIMPRRHRADFGNSSERERKDMAIALQNLLGRLHSKLNDPDYNLVLHSAPRYKEGEPHLHWYMEISPRITTKAGFELGTGLSINPTLPELDADFLNNIDNNIGNDNDKA